MSPSNVVTLPARQHSNSAHPRLTVQKADDLLATKANAALVTKINRNLSLTDEVWQKHYLFAIRKFASLAQHLPASLNHHHSYQGGLLTHTLEVLYNAVRIARGTILPPGTDAEQIRGNEERWRLGIFITALLHDAGKMLADIEVRYTKDTRQAKDSFVRWHAWYGPMPTGTTYVYRWIPKEGKQLPGLHERISIALLPHLLTPAASSWIQDDRALMAQMTATLTLNPNASGVIGEIIKEADRHSTASALGPVTGMQAPEVPKHELIMQQLRYMCNESNTKRNQPGAAYWVGSQVTWFSAKNTFEMVQEQLREAGHKGIPTQYPVTVGILVEHQRCIVPEQGFSWVARIIDPSRNNWDKQLTFVAIPNTELWPNGQAPLFQGSIIPCDSKGTALNPSSLPSVLLQVASNSDDEMHNNSAEVCTPTESASEEIHAESPAKPSVEPPSGEPTEPHAQSIAPQGPISGPKTGQPPAAESSVTSGNATSSTASIANVVKNDFLAWLANSVEKHYIRINEPEAPVHIVDGYVALVSPAIFKRYLEKNKLEAMMLGRNDEKRLQAIQKQVRTLNLHKRAKDGSDFVELIVAGPNRTSTISAMLFERHYFPTLANLSTNPIIHLP